MSDTKPFYRRCVFHSFYFAYSSHLSLSLSISGYLNIDRFPSIFQSLDECCIQQKQQKQQNYDLVARNLHAEWTPPLRHVYSQFKSIPFDATKHYFIIVMKQPAITKILMWFVLCENVCSLLWANQYVYGWNLLCVCVRIFVFHLSVSAMVYIFFSGKKRISHLHSVRSVNYWFISICIQFIHFLLLFNLFRSSFYFSSFIARCPCYW